MEIQGIQAAPIQERPSTTLAKSSMPYVTNWILAPDKKNQAALSIYLNSIVSSSTNYQEFLCNQCSKQAPDSRKKQGDYSIDTNTPPFMCLLLLYLITTNLVLYYSRNTLKTYYWYIPYNHVEQHSTKANNRHIPILNNTPPFMCLLLLYLLLLTLVLQQKEHSKICYCYLPYNHMEQHSTKANNRHTQPQKHLKERLVGHISLFT